jgi:hypothetical protein
MFTYTTLFLVSFIVAVVGIFVLKVIVDTRKAVNKSKERVELIERPPTHQYEGAERAAASGIQFPPEDAGQGMSWSAAKSTLAVADEHSVFQANDSGASTPDQPMVQDRSSGKTKGCSLFFDTEATEAVEPDVAKEPTGKPYKAAHHGPFDSLDD